MPGRLVRICCPGVRHQDIEVLGHDGFGFGVLGFIRLSEPPRSETSLSLQESTGSEVPSASLPITIKLVLYRLRLIDGYPVQFGDSRKSLS